MLFEHYKTALLSAIEQYQAKKGKAISKQRRKDCEDLISIIKSSEHTNALMLKAALEARLYKMKTGFWIFQTGHSELKKALHAILRAPQNQPEVISRAEVIVAEEQQQALQSKTTRLKVEIQVQEDKILLNKIQLKLQDRDLSSTSHHIRYEVYCLSVLDKFMAHQPLHAKEAELLSDLLDETTQNGFDMVMRKAINTKIADACQNAFNTLCKGIDQLIDHDTLIMPNFNATVQYAHHYCQSVKEPAATRSPYLERQLDKLLHSYCADGAGKTAVGCLSTYAKSLVAESKESLIIQHGNEAQRQHITPLCELRQASRWDAFKTKCLQWLREKIKTPRATPKGNKNILDEETPAHKNAVRKLVFV